MCAPAFLASSACLPSANTRILSSGLDFASLGSATLPLGTAWPFPTLVLTNNSKRDFGDATSTAYIPVEFGLLSAITVHTHSQNGNGINKW